MQENKSAAKEMYDSAKATTTAAMTNRRTRREIREQAEDAALLTVNTLLHAMVGEILTIEYRNDTVVCGRLIRADNRSK